MMSHIKQYIPDGGRNFSHTAFRQYVEHECCETERFYSDVNENLGDNTSITYDEEKNVYAHNPYTCKLMKNAKHGRWKNDFTSYDLEGILECLMYEIERRCEDGHMALIRSPLYYLIVIYQYNFAERNTERNMEDFVLWLKNDLFIWKENNPDKVREGWIPADTTFEEVSNIIRGECIIFEACCNVARQILNLKTSLYMKASVLGVELIARGWENRESSSAFIEARYGAQAEHVKFLPSNQINNLKTEWHKVQQYSSWCHLATHNQVGSILLRSERDIIFGQYYNAENCRPQRSLYAQINAFIMIHIPADPVVNSMTIASVTCRKYMEHGNSVAMVSAESAVSFEKGIRFVPISHLLPTQVAVSGLKASYAARNRIEGFTLIQVKVRTDSQYNQKVYLSSSHAEEITHQ